MSRDRDDIGQDRAGRFQLPDWPADAPQPHSPRWTCAPALSTLGRSFFFPLFFSMNISNPFPKLTLYLCLRRNCLFIIYILSQKSSFVHLHGPGTVRKPTRDTRLLILHLSFIFTATFNRLNLVELNLLDKKSFFFVEQTKDGRKNDRMTIRISIVARLFAYLPYNGYKIIDRT